jgi:hypothetical protein
LLHVPDRHRRLHRLAPITTIGCQLPNLSGLPVSGLVGIVEKFHDQLFPEYPECEGLREAARALYTQGDLAPLIRVLEANHLRVFDNRDYRWSNELTVKTVFLIALFADIFYVMDSETAIERGHADLSLMVREEMRRFALLDHLLEFKYLSLRDIGQTAETLREQPREALARLPVVAASLDAAEAQLARHRQGLEQAYGERLHLHTHAVVALGFERLLWRSNPEPRVLGATADRG